LKSAIKKLDSFGDIEEEIDRINQNKIKRG